MVIRTNHGIVIKSNITNPAIDQIFLIKFIFFKIEKNINGNKVKIIMIGPLISIPIDIAIQKNSLLEKSRFFKFISLYIIKLHIPINKNNKPSVFDW